jgi:PIN domain nuclease of toxin-antitoxin system
MLRAQLIGGAMSVVRQVVKREAKTKKEMWLKALAERRGNKCAAVALANKTVRTALPCLHKTPSIRLNYSQLKNEFIQQKNA